MTTEPTRTPQPGEWWETRDGERWNVRDGYAYRHWSDTLESYLPLNDLDLTRHLPGCTGWD